MKGLLRHSAYLLCIAALTLSCADARRGVVNVRLVATTDVHGNIFAIDAISGEQRDGSLARLASFLKAERKAHKNVVYVDCGDMLQGSIETYRDVTAEFYKPCLASEALNLLDCKAVAMGNHDLQVGTNSYDRYFSALSCPVLWGNLGFVRTGDYMPPYCIVQTGGVRIAFLGLTTGNVEGIIPSDVLGEMFATDMSDAARHWIPALKDKEKADVIVGLVHAGLELQTLDSVLEEKALLPLELAQSVPGFDLIVYGHDHISNMLKVQGADGDSLWIANPGPYGQYALVADISLDFSASDSPKPVISAGLEDLRGFQPDAEFAKSLSDRWDDVCQYADSVVGFVSEPLTATWIMEGRASALEYVHSIQMDYQGAQISLASCVQDTAVIPAGAVTVRDVFHLYPFDNSMVSLMLKGSEIKSILEYSVDEFLEKQIFNRFLTAAGIRYEINIAKPFGKRVDIQSMADGSAFNPDKYYRTTISSFLFGGSESVLPFATGLSQTELQRRLNASSRVDIKYYAITQLALAKERGDTVKIKRLTEWHMPPATALSGGIIDISETNKKNQ